MTKESWYSFDAAIDTLSRKIRPRMRDLKLDGIFGVPRGGLIVAVALSHKLKLPLLLLPTENSLVVDDISDTGKTLSRIKNKAIATLYSTEWTITKPDFHVYNKLDKDDWIVFPWENI